MSSKNRELPWANIGTARVRMTENYVWAFGPTILKKGNKYVLPKAVVGDILVEDKGILIKDKKDKKDE